MKIKAEKVFEKGDIPTVCAFCDKYKNCAMMDWYDEDLNPQHVDDAICTGYKNKLLGVLSAMLACAMAMGFVGFDLFFPRALGGILCFVFYKLTVMFNNKEDDQ